jgi:hypothetical protein
LNIAAILLMLVLVGLCIYGAFLGSEAAEEFFTSAVMQGFWCLCTAIAVAGANMNLISRNIACVLVYAGFAAVLIGFMSSTDGLIFSGYLALLAGVVWRLWFGQRGNKCR